MLLLSSAIVFIHTFFKFFLFSSAFFLPLHREAKITQVIILNLLFHQFTHQSQFLIARGGQGGRGRWNHDKKRILLMMIPPIQIRTAGFLPILIKALKLVRSLLNGWTRERRRKTKIIYRFRVERRLQFILNGLIFHLVRTFFLFFGR